MKPDRSSSALINGNDAAKTEADAWPVWKLTLISLPLMILTATWSVVLPNAAPFLVRLGMPLSLATLNNMAGPITGFLSAPVVGAVSDSLTSPLGRRRPVILVGLVCAWTSAMLLAASEHFVHRTTAVWFAAATFWLLDIALNMLMFPTRALVADLASGEQQMAVQVLPICMMSVGSFLGFSLLQLYDVPAEHMLELVLLCCMLLSVTIAVQVLLARETPLSRGAASAQLQSPVSGVLAAVRGSSPLLRRLTVVHCLVWVGLTTWLFYAGQWFSLCVFEGNPDAPADSEARRSYVDGQAAFAHAGQTKCVMSLMASLLLLWVLQQDLAAPRLLYAASLLVGAAATGSAVFVGHSVVLASICMALCSLPVVASNSIPFGMIAAQSKREEETGEQVSTALQMSLLNCSTTLGQQIGTGMLSVLELIGPISWALPTALLMSSGAMGMASILAIFISRNSITYSQGLSSDVEDAR